MAASKIKRVSAAKNASRNEREIARGIPPERTARAFEAGQVGRRLRAIPTTMSAINTQIRRYGKNIVARSRYLAVNNPYAASAKEHFIGALVGNGIKPSSLVTDAALKKNIQQAWLNWTDEADADGLTDFYGLQSLIAGEIFEAGECFARIRPRLASDGLSVPLQIQLLPSEMLPLWYNVGIPTGRIECGIEFDLIGRRVAYWFYKNFPGEIILNPSSAEYLVRVPASQVLHLYKPIRVGQIRGLPHTLAGMVTLAMLDLYDDAELERKRIAALFAAFIVRNQGEQDEEHPLAGAATNKNASDTAKPGDFALEPGAVIDLATGQDVKFAEPADVGSTYEAFQYRNLLRAAAGFGSMYSDMTGDLRQTSYGSQRAGLIPYRRRIEAQQHQMLAFQFCRPIWQAWFDAAVRTRVIKGINAGDYVDAPATFTAVKWIPPKWDWIDPLKDRQAEKLAVDSGFKPRSDVVEAEGYDPEENDQRIKQDQDRADQLGLKFIQLQTSVVVAPGSDEEPEPAAPAPGAENEDDKRIPAKAVRKLRKQMKRLSARLTVVQDKEFG